MFAKKFFYVCAGLMMLAIALSVGSSSVEGQSAGDPVVGVVVADAAGSARAIFAVTASGNVYKAPISNSDCSPRGEPCVTGWVMEPGIIGTPVAVDPATMGEVKAKFR